MTLGMICCHLQLQVVTSGCWCSVTCAHIILVSAFSFVWLSFFYICLNFPFVRISVTIKISPVHEFWGAQHIIPPEFMFLQAWSIGLWLLNSPESYGKRVSDELMQERGIHEPSEMWSWRGSFFTCNFCTLSPPAPFLFSEAMLLIDSLCFRWKY